MKKSHIKLPPSENKGVLRRQVAKKYHYRCYFWEHEVESSEPIDQCPICGHPVQEVDENGKKKS
jgi:rRNA maturation endonuclease Nob1